MSTRQVHLSLNTTTTMLNRIKFLEKKNQKTRRNNGITQRNPKIFNHWQNITTGQNTNVT